MATLKTTYLDDILNTLINTKRKYALTQNADGTYSFTDATSYSQVGDSFGAAELNAICTEVNSRLYIADVLNVLGTNTDKAASQALLKSIYDKLFPSAGQISIRMSDVAIYGGTNYYTTGFRIPKGATVTLTTATVVGASGNFYASLTPVYSGNGDVYFTTTNSALANKTIIIAYTIAYA